MTFYHLFVLFALGNCAFSGILEESSIEGKYSGNLSRLDPHEKGPSRPLSDPPGGGAINGMAVADNGEN